MLEYCLVLRNKSVMIIVLQMSYITLIRRMRLCYWATPIPLLFNFQFRNLFSKKILYYFISFSFIYRVRVQNSMVKPVVYSYYPLFLLFVNQIGK
jgi:hypothetical protein